MMISYWITGNLVGFVWDDFFSDDGPNVTISVGEERTIVGPDSDGWYDAVILDDGNILASVISILAEINGVSVEEIVLDQLGREVSINGLRVIM